MCGITAGIAQRDIAPVLLEGLKRLEYRGYDSAGIAVIAVDQTLTRQRIAGKVKQLAAQLEKHPIAGNIGIAHTRWATHGEPNEQNAHPHMSKQHLALVHNGIIENYRGLKKALAQQGYTFTSETDSEAIVHAIDAEIQYQSCDLLTAVQRVVKRLEGAYALAVTAVDTPDAIVVARMGSPLVIGVAQDAHYIASDPLALLPVTQSFIYLEEGDVAKIYVDRYEIYDRNGQQVERAISQVALSAEATGLGRYQHYMQKEIFEQPAALQATLKPFNNTTQFMPEWFGAEAADIFKQVQQIQIVGCGTSLHAGLIARHWFESITKLPCSVDPASELRYMDKQVPAGTLLIAISQSGETADTLAAVKHSFDQGYVGRLSICNVPQSALVRTAELSFLIQAGPEIGVASTKTFTATLTSLLTLAGTIAAVKGTLSTQESHSLFTSIQQIPIQMASWLSVDSAIKTMAAAFAGKAHALYLGRGIYYPVALEGALKLKEISYIHAEAYPAGELKHGPLALVDEAMPVVVVMPNDRLQDKLKSNLQEVKARGGALFIFAAHGVAVDMEADEAQVIHLPACPEAIAPILFSLPLQLLSYYIAVLKGTNVDQPRNLAKSVTVE